MLLTMSRKIISTPEWGDRDTSQRLKSMVLQKGLLLLNQLTPSLNREKNLLLHVRSRLHTHDHGQDTHKNLSGEFNYPCFGK